MPSIILAVIMFCSGLAAGWLYWRERLKMRDELIRALEDKNKSLIKSCSALSGYNKKLINDRYYRRAQA